MFGRKKEEPEQPPLLMATVETVPWAYEILSVVQATSRHRLRDCTYDLLDDLEAAARELGADAVIGVRFEGDSTSLFTGSVAYGTAVRRLLA